MSNQYFRILARAPMEPRRSALLEQLLARADASRPVGDWRADAFRILAPQASAPAIAPAALCADGGAADAAWACLATPVHYVAEMTSVRLSEDGILSMKPAAAATLAADFNLTWNGAGVRLLAGKASGLYCLFDQLLNVTTRDPQDGLGRRIEEYLPTGADAPRLRQLMSEIEMWLFEHGENSAREAAGLPRIRGLWLWGGGAPLASLPSVQGWVAGGDVYFSALAAECNGTAERRATSDSGVIVAAATPGSDEWHDIESRWLTPAAVRLRAGRLSRLEISAGDRCFSLTARAIRRFWRRSKPWWETFG